VFCIWPGLWRSGKGEIVALFINGYGTRRLGWEYPFFGIKDYPRVASRQTSRRSTTTTDTKVQNSVSFFCHYPRRDMHIVEGVNFTAHRLQNET
jgi:hypothetical protein